MGIRVVPQAGPKEVCRHLEPTEPEVITVRKHPVRLMLGFLPLVLVLIDYVLRATGAVHGNAQARRILIILIAPCFLLAVVSVAAWLRGWVVITSQRLLIFGWWRIGHVTQMPITAADQLAFIRTLPGRLFGYGTFRLKRPGSRWRVIKVRFLPYPEQLYLETIGLVFRESSPDDDPAALSG
jgi:hypothetical protein